MTANHWRVLAGKSRQLLFSTKSHVLAKKIQQEFFKARGRCNFQTIDPSKENFFNTTHGNYRASILSRAEDIIEAQSLMYSIYVEECNWRWTEDNPTGFHVNEHDNKKYITDNFEQNSVWIGTSHRDKLVSCNRIVYRTESSGLDIECYEDSRKPAVRNVLNQTNLAEIQRSFTRAEYRGKGLVCLNMAVAAKVCISNQLSNISTGHTVYMAKYHPWKIVDNMFGYGDGIPVNVVYYPEEDLRVLLALSTKEYQQRLGETFKEYRK